MKMVGESRAPRGEPHPRHLMRNNFATVAAIRSWDYAARGGRRTGVATATAGRSVGRLQKYRAGAQNKEAESIWRFHRQLCHGCAFAGLLLFNANVRRVHASTPLHRDPICAKLSMIEWQIENLTFNARPPSSTLRSRLLPRTTPSRRCRRFFRYALGLFRLEAGLKQSVFLTVRYYFKLSILG